MAIQFDDNEPAYLFLYIPRGTHGGATFLWIPHKDPFIIPGAIQAFTIWAEGQRQDSTLGTGKVQRRLWVRCGLHIPDCDLYCLFAIRLASRGQPFTV